MDLVFSNIQKAFNKVLAQWRGDSEDFVNIENYMGNVIFSIAKDRIKAVSLEIKKCVLFKTGIANYIQSCNQPGFKIKKEWFPVMDCFFQEY